MSSAHTLGSAGCITPPLPAMPGGAQCSLNTTDLLTTTRRVDGMYSNHPLVSVA